MLRKQGEIVLAHRLDDRCEEEGAVEVQALGGTSSCGKSHSP